MILNPRGESDQLVGEINFAKNFGATQKARSEASGQKSQIDVFVIFRHFF